MDYDLGCYLPRRVVETVDMGFPGVGTTSLP